MYYTEEDRQKRAAKKVESYRNIAALFPAFCRVARKYDGKVYNKRFTEALREEMQARIFSEKRYNFIDFYLYDDFNDLRTFARLSLEDMKDGKRINAEKLIESAREHRADYLSRAYKIETIAPQIPTIKAYISELTEKINIATKPLDYELKELFGLSVRVEIR